MRTVEARNSKENRMNASLGHAAPSKKRTDSRGRRPNTHYRRREYLTESEVNKLLKAARGNRHSHRDSTMVLIAYRHGLRA